MSASTQPAPVPIRPPGRPAPGPVPVPPPAEPRRPRWRLPLLILLAGLLGAALYLLLKPGSATQVGSADLVRTAGVTSGPLARVVRVAGQTSARNFASIMVPVFRGPDSGRDLTLMKVAKAGSFVKKGDAVAELDAQALKDHIDDVNDQVAQAENDVLKKKAEQDVEWESLQQSLRVAKADRDKTKLDFSAAEVKTEVERELLKLAADEAEAAYKELQGDLANKKAADRAEVRILQITVQKQQIHRNNHVGDLKKFTMKAPMDGLVVMSQTFRGGEMKQIQEGDQVYPGMQFMKIVDTRSMQMEASVSQADASELRVGQVATVGLDAFPGLQFSGKIYSIGAMAVKGMWDTYYIRNVPVRIAIGGSDSRLIPDLSAWAHVHLDLQENATIVPTEAVRSEGGQTVVFVKRDKGFEKRPVALGLRTTTQVAVLTGLRPGEQVALGPVK
jgi:HlyD family secretion protein